MTHPTLFPAPPCEPRGLPGSLEAGTPVLVAVDDELWPGVVVRCYTHPPDGGRLEGERVVVKFDSEAYPCAHDTFRELVRQRR